MNTSYQDSLVMPYGTSGIRPEMLLQLQDGNYEDLQRPGAPVVVIEPLKQRTLRMHSLLHPFTLPPVAQELAHAESQLTFLSQHLCKLCGNWAKPQQQFVNRFIRELRLHVSANTEQLQIKTDGLQGLIETDHWCFSAPMPLPRAHIYAPEDTNDRNYKPEDFTCVDFAFWSGSQLHAILISNGNSVTRSRKKALERVNQAGVTITTLDNTTLNESKPLALLPALGNGFLDFVHETVFPHSPFRGRGIDAPIAL